MILTFTKVSGRLEWWDNVSTIFRINTWWHPRLYQSLWFGVEIGCTPRLDPRFGIGFGWGFQSWVLGLQNHRLILGQSWVLGFGSNLGFGFQSWVQNPRFFHIFPKSQKSKYSLQFNINYNSKTSARSKVLVEIRPKTWLLIPFDPSTPNILGSILGQSWVNLG